MSVPVVLFGAGASYGCGAALPVAPPLGPSLFRVLQRLFSSWRAVPESVGSVFERNFEDGMQLIIDNHGFAIAPLMQDMAVFFAGFGHDPQVRSLYLDVLERVKRTDVLWSSLNYECILEFAAARLGRQVAYFSDPIDEPNHAAVWKLHGSCNFKVAGLEAGRGVSFGTGVAFNGGIEPIEPSAVRGHYKGNTALYPAMALFARGKPIAMSPDPITDAQRRWAVHVDEATHIAVVGVHPNPDDAHVWGPLAETRGAIAYIGAVGPFEKWQAAHRGGRPSKFLGATWAVAREPLIAFLNE